MGIYHTVTVLIIIFILVVYKDILSRKVFSPAFVFSFIWLLQYILYIFFYSEGYILSTETNNLLISTVITFTIGTFFTEFILQTVKRKSDSTIVSIIKTRDFLLIKYKKMIFFGFLGIIIGLIVFMRRGLFGPYDFIFNIRYMHIYGEEGFQIYPYLILILHITILLLICYRDRLGTSRDKFIVFLSLILIASGFIDMAKSAILMSTISIISTLVISNYYFYNKKIIINRKIIIFGVLMLILTEIMNFFRGGTKSYIVEYITYPIVAFDKVVLSKSSLGDGSGVFPLPTMILEKLGWFEINTVDLEIGPADFNVFTSLATPYIDYGFLGTTIVFLFIGMVYGIVYSVAILGKPLWIVYYSVMLYPLVTSFFAFQFNLTSMVYYLIILIFLSFLSKNNSMKFVNFSKIN